MSLVEKQISMIFSSDPVNGALATSALGDRFSVSLYRPLGIPKEAVHATLECVQSSIWYTTPNISANLGNNKLYVTQDATSATLTIPDGLYTLELLTKQIARILDDGGFPSDLFVLLSESSTQRVIIVFNYTGVSVDFTSNDTPRDIMGFNANLVGPSTIIGEDLTAPNVARFNTLNSYLVHGDIVSTSIPVNETEESVMMNALITTSPGSLLNSVPYNPVKIDASELIGHSKSQLNFWLTSETGQPIDTQSDYWSFLVVIRYYVPIQINNNKH